MCNLEPNTAFSVTWKADLLDLLYFLSNTSTITLFNTVVWSTPSLGRHFPVLFFTQDVYHFLWWLFLYFFTVSLSPLLKRPSVRGEGRRQKGQPFWRVWLWQRGEKLVVAGDCTSLKCNTDLWNALGWAVTTRHKKWTSPLPPCHSPLTVLHPSILGIILVFITKY